MPLTHLSDDALKPLGFTLDINFETNTLTLVDMQGNEVLSSTDPDDLFEYIDNLTPSPVAQHTTMQVKHPQLSGLASIGYRVVPNYTTYTVSLLDPDNELVIESYDAQVICDKIDEIISDLVDDNSDKWGDE